MNMRVELAVVPAISYVLCLAKVLRILGVVSRMIAGAACQIETADRDSINGLIRCTLYQNDAELRLILLR